MKELEKPDLESLWLFFRSPRMPRWLCDIGVGVIYNPPGANDRLMCDHIISCVDVITKHRPYAYAGIAVAGDFNRLRDAPLCSYPLKQTVKTATRGAVFLDKIYTNIADWYSQPVVIPKIATADHLSVLMRPCSDGDHRRSLYRKTMETRNHDHNGKVMLAHNLNSYNWDHLYKMSTCDEMTSCFYNTVTQMLDKFASSANCCQQKRLAMGHTGVLPNN